MCVCKRECAHEGEIHYLDNESIWDNMRQFTSPVVVSSIQEEDTFPSRSQRTLSSAVASLARLPMDAAPAAELCSSQVDLYKSFYSSEVLLLSSI